MTATILQRLRETAADLSEERVSMKTLAQAHGPAAHGARSRGERLRTAAVFEP